MGHCLFKGGYPVVLFSTFRRKVPKNPLTTLFCLGVGDCKNNSTRTGWLEKVVIAGQDTQRVVVAIIISSSTYIETPIYSLSVWIYQMM
jgi:hypothetical protein